MNLDNFFRSIVNALPGIFGALLLLVVALVVAWAIKRFTITVLNKIDFDQQLQHWGFAKSKEEANVFIETIASILYFIVIILFLPSILAGLNIGGALNPIVAMFATFLAFIPNLLMALIILVIGGYFCNFIKRLVKNILTGLNIDKWYRKVTKQSVHGLNVNENQMADVLSSVVYVLLYIPILTVALETLGIQSISQPIIDVLNQILGAIPNIFAAVVMLVIGSFVGKLLGDVVEGLLSTSGIDQYSKYLNFKGESQLKISGVIGVLVQSLLTLFFIVEAINILNLDVLNAIGSSIIAYIPAVISAVIILALGLIGGNIFANFIKQVSGSSLFSELVRFTIIALAIFMTLDQLKIAQTIVNSAFVIILGALAGAFVLAFGLGGKDYAHRKLEEIDHTLAKEGEQSNQIITDPQQTLNEDNHLDHQV
ncbi:mechanosensitive ion channel [Ignavigranum ruoffiae]|uniref:Conserved TM helix n=2 Tax=Ignavigranum ruoffiae TaxID=89093 RepID=A0A1H9D8G1_9LACT|nr:mechanosensitive ion channel [Ignavigranum ruoffiae]SEQ09734.1 Conserved TM helix [Ignavigranum ruoffiae]